MVFEIAEKRGFIPRRFHCGHWVFLKAYRAIEYDHLGLWRDTKGDCPKCREEHVRNYIRVCPRCTNLICCGMRVGLERAADLTAIEGVQSVAGAVMVCGYCADEVTVVGIGYWNVSGYVDHDSGVS